MTNVVVCSMCTMTNVVVCSMCSMTNVVVCSMCSVTNVVVCSMCSMTNEHPCVRISKRYWKFTLIEKKTQQCYETYEHGYKTYIH